MNKTAANIAKYVLWTAVAALLLYFSFRGVSWSDFGAALSCCKWAYIALSMLIGALVFYLRALRWRMQLLPIDPGTSRITCWNAYNICMLVNLILPRVGEVVRCGYITRHSTRDAQGQRRATVDKVLGTVLVDRLWDVVSLLLVMGILLPLMWHRFGAYLTGLAGGLSGNTTLVWGVGAIAVAAALFLWLCWRNRLRGGLWTKVWGAITGVLDGLRSCLHMRRGGMFIVYTVLIWFCYWMMSYTCLLALQGLDPAAMSPELAGSLQLVDGLTAVDALFLMFAGALSSVIPVPGGFGAFHTIVAGALASIYGIPFGLGMVFATLSHESQVLTDALCGLCSWVAESFRKA